MRGVSNAVSAIFVIAIILSIVYLATYAMIAHISAVAKAQREAMDHQIERSQVAYGEITVDGNNIVIDYTGRTGEYAIRLFCTDLNTHKKYCVVPTLGGKKSVSYWDSTYPTALEVNLEFNVAGCGNGMWKDLNDMGLLCYIIGLKSDEQRFIMAQ